MPTYEYRCKSCGYEFDEFQSITADPLLVCPKCAKPALKRLMSSGAGLVFKGSGFYQTDYKKTGSSVPSSKESTKPAPDTAAAKTSSASSAPPAPAADPKK